MKKNYFISGEFNLTCDVCSKKIKAHESKLRWDGLIVCKDDWETRHPQDFVLAKTDKITIPYQRPIPPLVFTNIIYGNMYVDDNWTIFGYFEGTEL